MLVAEIAYKKLSELSLDGKDLIDIRIDSAKIPTPEMVGMFSYDADFQMLANPFSTYEENISLCALAHSGWSMRITQRRSTTRCKIIFSHPNYMFCVSFKIPSLTGDETVAEFYKLWLSTHKGGEPNLLPISAEPKVVVQGLEVYDDMSLLQELNNRTSQRLMPLDIPKAEVIDITTRMKVA